MTRTGSTDAAGAPRVSVLIPAWQAERTLPAALESVRRQSVAHLECVIVDDGSTDRTGDVAAGFERRDRRFRVLRTPHGGLVSALQHGLGACRGRRIARLDADDVMRRDRLELQLRALDADPGLAGVGAHVRLFPRSVLTDGARRYEAWLNAIDSPAAVARDAFVECPLAHPTLCLDAGLFRRYGYRRTGWAEDYDLVLRILGDGHRLGIVPRRLVAWRDSPHRLQRTDPAYSLESFTACKAAFLARGFLAGAPGYVLWGHGGTGRALRQALSAHGKRPELIVELHPGRLGNRIDGAPVVPPEALRDRPPGRLIASVAGESARARIRAALHAWNWRETTDFICAA